MNVPAIKRGLERLSSWRQSNGTGTTTTPLPEETPLRSDLFSVDQLARHARALAETHELAASASPDKLIRRLQDNERLLVQTYDLVTAAVSANRRISPAAEWLLDNFYLIEEQIRTARRHLPRSYGRELPRLAGGTDPSHPRVYAIALELISHVDGRLDAVSLDAFIASYQTVKPLKLGELWAVPIVLRLALIENLRRVAARIGKTRMDRDAAHEWAQRMVSVVEQAPTDLILVLADMARADPPLSGAFLGELTRHLQGQSPYFSFATSWIEQRLTEQGLTIEQLVRADGHAQAADQVSIGNSITSLRFLSSTDWREFVERHSAVEKTLRQDPAGIYADMDFATRDRYRHGVEGIAKRSGLAEDDVARRAVSLAGTQSVRDPKCREAHVGYYLIDRGCPALEQFVRARPSFRTIAARIGRSAPLFLYLSAIVMIAAGVLAVFASWGRRHGAGASLLWLLIPAAMCAVHLGIAVVNWFATALVTPRPLPRLDFDKGIPPQHRTMVVVPTMLSSIEAVASLLDGLEVRYLANRDANLHFALLTDFDDAASETAPGDEELVRVAAEGIEQLNEKYAPPSGAERAAIFHLFHRPRRWNAQEGVWMGFERKRGKLADFNALLRAAPAAGQNSNVGRALPAIEPIGGQCPPYLELAPRSALTPSPGTPGEGRGEGLPGLPSTQVVPVGSALADASQGRAVGAGFMSETPANASAKADPTGTFSTQRRGEGVPVTQEKTLTLTLSRSTGRGDQTGSGLPNRFSRIVGDTTFLPGVRYVITLDTDTQLPRDAAREMAGAMAHPLNRPVFDPKRNRVVDGYGILQPRVGVSLPSAGRSWFVRLFAGDTGVDPYTRVVSDVYQDLFGEGSFIGKGIYDVDAFEQSCRTFPDNTVLSHDLLESAYARSGLLSDVELYEDYPSRYPADVSRRHRWIRGDWQIARWLLPRVPALNGQHVVNPISVLSWWKIVDNLRRSLVPVAMLTLLLGAWLFLPALGAPATALALAAIGAGSVIALSGSAVRKPAEMTLLVHLRLTISALGIHLSQFLFTLVFLPYDAYVSIDAIARTAARMLWTRRKLLEWKTSSDAHRSARTDLSGFIRSMGFAPGISLVIAILLAIARRQLPVFVAPLLYLWLVSPIVAWWLSRPLSPAPTRLSKDQRVFLEKLGRRTWQYFEEFVTQQENWLPPDNVQEHPTQIIAPRTSPTNIGMALLANLAACDFGYCSVGRLLDRTQKTFATLGRMERYRGHFYNWYDIRSLKPLIPMYVSMVDSGNLAGHLLVMRQGLLELKGASILPARLFRGLRDTVHVLFDAARGLHHVGATSGRPLVAAEILHKIERIESDLGHPPVTLRASVEMLSRLATIAKEIVTGAGVDEEVQGWARTFERSCSDHRDDLLLCAPWLALPPIPEKKQWASAIPVGSALADAESRVARETSGASAPSSPYAGQRAGMRGQFREERNSMNRPSPQPSPLSTGEREPEVPPQNEDASLNEGRDASAKADPTASRANSPNPEMTVRSADPTKTSPASWQKVNDLLQRLDAAPSLLEIAALYGEVIPILDDAVAQYAGDAALSGWLAQLRQAMIESSHQAAERLHWLELISQDCHDLADMDFSFLYDKSRDLFSIGFNVADRRLDNSFYDLLASEARLGSFVAIAQGQVGQEHWFALGRLLTATGATPALLSWSGSMFEFLMPLLVMPTYENTLLDQTCRAVVRRQISYGKQRGVPWGISESGYNTTDQHLNYQYRAFGVPGLGLKRGLADDLVIAPYATAMALMVAPEAACRNLEKLSAEGQQGAYGMYEAIDYTPSRLLPGTNHVTIRQFMAHHEGMSLLSLAYLLLDKPMQRRFDADPMLRAADLLLQERIPKASAPVFPHAMEAGTRHTASAEEEGTMRIFTDPGGGAPEVHLLSNGRYHVAVTSAGGGYSRWRDTAVTRWREDATRDCWGTFCYLRDTDSGALWSTSFQPTLKSTKRYEAIFTQARAEFRRRDDGIETHTEISVSPEDDIELRRISLTNRSETVRTIEVTSYAEIVLAPRAQDLAHPAFSNLFVQTELVRDRRAILCKRRPRSIEEHPPWLMHLMTVGNAASIPKTSSVQSGSEPSTVGEASFETDRMKFIGRGGSLTAPAALATGAPLSDSEGSVLDPIVSIRQVIRLQPGETVRVDLITGVAETRQAVTDLMDKYHDTRLADRVFELAWTHANVLLRQLNASEADAQAFGRLASSVLYASSLRRARGAVLARNRRGQSGLWGYGISGDLPIVLVRIRDRSRIELVRQAVQAHAYWRLKGLTVDLVIWNEDDSIYRQTSQDAIMDLVAASPEAALVDKPGGIFVRRGEQMSEEDRALLQTVARVVLFDEAGTLIEQVERRGRGEVAIPVFKPGRRRTEPVMTAAEVPQRDLTFFNGLGGFSRDGREYIIVLSPDQTTPAPWVNVIANAQFGTVISESGSAYTWSENSHEFRMTPWYDDPVSDVSGEAFYIRDEESGRFWSPSPLPARGGMPYVSRHGFGYSIFEYEDDGIVTELCIYVATDAPIKFAKLRITNRSGRSRQLSVTGFWEWVLGEMRDKTLMHVITELDSISGALFTRNAYNIEFPGRVVFVDSSETLRTVTADRTEFLGRNGSAAKPAAMRRIRLSGRVSAGLDPCSAMQVQANVEDGQTREIVFTLGAGADEDQARQLVYRFRGIESAHRALEGVWHYWSRTLGVAYFETPDPAVNFLANGWLVYQTLACRMWARTGFYQSGGAFGFRDQLQDAMSLIHAEPGLFREHLLRAAARQFVEGDVQHWWHPPAGRGVRTHFSDDYLWLAYASCRYVASTGDTGVLDERVPFLISRLLRADEEAYYDLPRVSDNIASLYDHCVRAIDNGLRFGTHGLPLMGCGDWNDGMNLVGEHGKGESVWLAFFLFDVLTQFTALARRRGDVTTADRYTVEAGRLRGHIEANAWDGQWYRRAYFDDGTPLGSASNDECQIDALPQSWSVLSGAGMAERSQIAMQSVDQRLVRRDDRQIRLFDPPFDKSALNPGYIKGYVPGVRENGGQYTHAAIWTIMAFADMGDSQRAWELFSMINPLEHGSTAKGISVYKVEPYVVAADVYGVAPHIGRGGWTWYTGSAGWMYRLITESLLGLHLEVDKLRFAPRIPKTWESFKIHYRYRETFYHITLRNSGGANVIRIIVDGTEQSDKILTLVDDRKDHNVEVELGE